MVFYTAHNEVQLRISSKTHMRIAHKFCTELQLTWSLKSTLMPLWVSSRCTVFSSPSPAALNSCSPSLSSCAWFSTGASVTSSGDALAGAGAGAVSCTVGTAAGAAAGLRGLGGSVAGCGVGLGAGGGTGSAPWEASLCWSPLSIFRTDASSATSAAFCPSCKPLEVADFR